MYVKLEVDPSGFLVVLVVVAEPDPLKATAQTAPAQVMVEYGPAAWIELGAAEAGSPSARRLSPAATSADSRDAEPWFTSRA